MAVIMMIKATNAKSAALTRSLGCGSLLPCKSAIASPPCRRAEINSFSIRIALSIPSWWVWSRRRLILCVGLAEAAQPARGVHALLKCCETAICTAASPSTAVKGAPRIVLGLSWSDVEHSCRRDNAEHKRD